MLNVPKAMEFASKMLEKEGATIVAFPRLQLRNFTI